MKYILIALIIATTLASCGVDYNLRRMAYHKRMAIAKGASIQADTIYADRVEIIPGDSTTITIPGPERRIIHDTIIYQDRIKIRIRRDTITERIQVECPPDTIRIRVPVAVTEQLCPPPDNKWKWIAGGLFVLLAVALAGVAKRR